MCPDPCYIILMFKEPRPESNLESLKAALKREASFIEKLNGSCAKWLGMAVLALSTEGCYGLMPQSVNQAWADQVDTMCKATSGGSPDCKNSEKMRQRYDNEENWDKRDRELVKRWNTLPDHEKNRLVITYGVERIEKTRWAYSHNEFRY